MSIIDHLLGNRIPEALIRATPERASTHRDKPTTPSTSNPTTALSGEEH